MASFHVTGVDNTAKTVGNDDTGTIDSGATLSAATAVTWTAGSANPGVIIDNSGTISATTRGIDTSGSLTTGSITLNNNAGAKLISSGNDAFRINNSHLTTGTITVDNSGYIVSGALDGSNNIILHSSGQALDFGAVAAPNMVINITNYAGAVIGASGDDAIRPGAGIVTIINDGLIDATASASRAINLNTDDLAHLTSFDLTNSSTGTIQSMGDAVRITAGTLSNAAYTVSIDNAGTIESTGTTDATNGQAIDFKDLTSTTGQIHITNDATGLISAADADAIRAGVNTIIDNYGQIVSDNAAGDFGDDGIDFQGNSGGVVNNYTGGTIDGARHGITGDDAITVYNTGIITGHLGSGINMDTPSLSMTTVTNHGTIVGTGGYLGGDINQPVDGDGIRRRRPADA